MLEVFEIHEFKRFQGQTGLENTVCEPIFNSDSMGQRAVAAVVSLGSSPLLSPGTEAH